MKPDLFEYCKQMRGFNYNPSYCRTIYDIWNRFDSDVWRTEITRGKEYFPNMNMIRIWLDWGAYSHDPQAFLSNLDNVLYICDGLGIDVNPTLFNRWHYTEYDVGGIYYDHFIDRSYNQQLVECNYKVFEQYIADVVGTFKDDKRINMWDLCNEPQHWEPSNPLHQAEVSWLNWINKKVRETGQLQPVTVGTMVGKNVEWVADLCDVLCFHIYDGWWNNEFELECKKMVLFANKQGKPLITNETCQGSIDDDVRTEIIHKSLGILKKYEIGWCVWQLHGGKMVSANPLITDKNCREGDIAYFAFIDEQGVLRKGHEAFNQY